MTWNSENLVKNKDDSEGSQSSTSERQISSRLWMSLNIKCQQRDAKQNASFKKLPSIGAVLMMVPESRDSKLVQPYGLGLTKYSVKSRLDKRGPFKPPQNWV